ncbi:hypothetical protein [Moraxella oculi]|uniref:Uncharacterized protein n=1 Tax=Moraxella oculi TaxID=2940516 RepID=A0ABW8U6I3_9GAMM
MAEEAGRWNAAYDNKFGANTPKSNQREADKMAFLLNVESQS